MAVTLPTFTINDQAKIDRMMAMFVDAAGYKEWLRQAIAHEVLRREAVTLREQADQLMRQAQAAAEQPSDLMDGAT